MPYIDAKDRSPLDRRVNALAGELASKLSHESNGDTEVSLCYKQSVLSIANTLRSLQQGKKLRTRGKAKQLAQEIFLGAKKHGYRGAWVGGLDYALTRLIQACPCEDGRDWRVERGVSVLGLRADGWGT